MPQLLKISQQVKDLLLLNLKCTKIVGMMPKPKVKLNANGTVG